MMKHFAFIAFLCVSVLCACGGGSDEPKKETPTAVTITVNHDSFSVSPEAAELQLNVSVNADWNIDSDQSWCRLSTSGGLKNVAKDVRVTVSANPSTKEREAVITVRSGSSAKEVRVHQDGVQQEEVPFNVPEGYTLVWHDEFDNASLNMPDEELWWYEVWNPGTVNNELQRYVAGRQGDIYTASVVDGILRIQAHKSGSEVISARLNTRESWKYGYFEARLKLPKGRGTWPAFWMMPKQNSAWPACGEIDIMEEVGYHPNYTSSSIHCEAYNHMIGTQKTREVYTPKAEDEFHVYALEWTADYIRTYVDGNRVLDFANDHAGKNATWPFNKEFYLKLNLAWGGDWGGQQGVDESALPATYEIDYVRVFQKQ